MVEIAEREAALTPDKPKSYTRLGRSIQRCRCAVEFFTPALPATAAQDLIGDLARLETRLENLDHYRRLQKQLSQYVDSWAQQQAKGKAPQLHGAHSVLDYSHARRATWEAGLRELKEDLALVRPARLRQRLTALLRTVKDTPPPPGL